MLWKENRKNLRTWLWRVSSGNFVGESGTTPTPPPDPWTNPPSMSFNMEDKTHFILFIGGQNPLHVLIEVDKTPSRFDRRGQNPHYVLTGEDKAPNMGGPTLPLTPLLLNKTCPVLANSVDPDQLASELDLHYLLLNVNSKKKKKKIKKIKKSTTTKNWIK